jgi:hypothetical protein
MAKKKTNEQLVKHIMNFSGYGVLSQAFVMTAIQKYADACAKADPKMFDSPMLHGDAWVGVAKEIKAKMDEHYA